MRLINAQTISLSDRFARIEGLAAEGVANAVRGAGKGLQAELRAQVRSARLGQGLEKAWSLNVYPPNKRGSLSAAAWLYSKAARLHRVFDEGAVIRAANGTWLAIPLQAIIQRGMHLSMRKSAGSLDRRHSDVEAAVAAYGEKNVAFVPISHGRALVVYRPPGRRSLDPVHDFVPLFLLIRQVRIRKRLGIAAPARQWFLKMQGEVASALQRALENG